MIALDHVSHRYDDRTALDDVSFSIAPGELAFVVGPSGAGKTTLLRLVNGDLRVQSGRVEVAGLGVDRLARRHLGQLRRRVGVVFQDYKLLPALTALENVAFAYQIAHLAVPSAHARDLAQQALAAVELHGRESAFPSELSGGEQQRLAIARAAVATPAVLLADEPAAALDRRRQSAVIGILERLAAAGAAVLVATHDVEPRLARAHRCLRLGAGRLVEAGAPEAAPG